MNDVESQLQATTAALRKYGRHSAACLHIISEWYPGDGQMCGGMSPGYIVSTTVKCICGLDAALKKHDGG